MSESLSWSSYWVLLIFASTAVKPTLNQADHNSFLERDYCMSKEICHECIQTPQCAWCSALRFTSPRCFSLRSFNSSIFAECPAEFIQNPDNSLSLIRNVQLTKDNSSAVNGHSYGESSFSSSFSSSSINNTRQETVQLSPQELRLSLRLHEPYNISFSYAQANDFPVDLYYITNFRQPIENGNTDVIKLGNSLVESLRNVTSDFRWGFGSTISYSRSGSIEKIYGFKQMRALSQDARRFADLEHNFPISNNPAAMDGGLDAIFKAIVCCNQIGWRSNSKKLLVFATDTAIPENITTLGEAMRWNYEQCNFSESGFSASSQRHHTITEINRLVRKNRINILWVVTNEQYHKFERVTRYVEGSFALLLSTSSITIPDLIQEQYQSISSSVEIKDTAIGNVEVRYFSSCLEDGAIHKTAKCNRLKVGTNVQFLAEIEATRCPANKSEWHRQFLIYPVGINESLTVDLNIICDCDCENPSNHLYETHSQYCMRVGTLKCGICECNDGYFGRSCECSSSPEISDRICKPDNTSLVDCSGRGNCVCGNCDCEPRSNPKETISGRFCECDNFSCERNNLLLCSNHGTCECGQCVCDKLWSGRDCSCKLSTNDCWAPGNVTGVICSGHGECNCGKCICNTSQDFLYSGRFCQDIVHLA